MTLDLERLLSALVDEGVAFILVGGLAARAHGASRVTQDVDICYGRDSLNLARLVTALGPFDPYLRGVPRGLPFDWSVQTLRTGLNFTLTTTSGDIDLLGELVGGGTYDDLISHTETIAVFDRSIRLLDIPWLIRVKQAAGRPKDLEVIAELELLQDERRQMDVDAT
jgi:hypothetical protein